MDTVDRTKNTCVQHNHKKKLNKKGKPNCACAFFLVPLSLSYSRCDRKLIGLQHELFTPAASSFQKYF